MSRDGVELLDGSGWKQKNGNYLMAAAPDKQAYPNMKERKNPKLLGADPEYLCSRTARAKANAKRKEKAA